jgi:lysozyme
MVDRCLTIEAPDRTWIAMTSWAWNLGTGRFCKDIAPVANAKGLRAACDKMQGYDRAAGIRMRGLTRRRATEYALCIADL